MSDMSKIDERALFSDESGMFRMPEEPDPGDILTIRFRTLKNNVDKVTLYMQFGKPAKRPVPMNTLPVSREAVQSSCRTVRKTGRTMYRMDRRQ